MSNATIAPEKLRAYRASSYRLAHADTEIILKIGTVSLQVIDIFKVRQVSSGAFLTAFNPSGSQQTDAENELAHAHLVAEMASLGVHVIEGSGSEEGTDWPAERSLFALGLGLTDAEKLGRLFKQDAFVWVGADGKPELVLL